MFAVKKAAMNKISKELIGASSVPIILSILSTGESYGYDIIQRVKEVSGGRIAYGDGTLYPVLHKLEKRGLIQSFWRNADSGRRRKYYKISEEGRAGLLAEKESWTSMNEIILKLWKIEPNLT